MLLKTPFHYFPFGSTGGNLLILSLTLLYGSLAFLRSLYQFVTNPLGFFAVKDRTGKEPKLINSGRYGTHRFMKTSSNVKLHYVSGGDQGGNRQAMVFVHGFPECWFSWRHQIEEFSKRYHTVAVSMRGYGDSDKPTEVGEYAKHKLVDDIVDLIRSVVSNKNPKCILVAHDWGGAICWTVAATHPELVDRFVVMNAPHPNTWAARIASNWSQFFASWYMFYFNFPLLPEIAIRSNDLKIFDLLFSKFCNQEQIEVYKYYFGRGGLKSITGPLNYYRAILRGYGSLDGTNQKHIMKHVTVQPKTLIIWGKDDRALIPEIATDSKKFCQDSQVHYIENCSHWVQLDKPAEVNQIMNKFLQ